MKKANNHSHIVRNTFLYSMLVVGIIFSALVAPWEELQTSLIDSANTSQEDILSSLQSMNLTLLAMKQENSVDTYILTQDMVGTTSFTIQENTCKNGAKVTMRLNDTNKLNAGSLQIVGVAANKSRSVYSAVVALDENNLTEIRYLPNSVILEDDTVFVNYQISKGNYADKVKYTVECY